MKSSFLVNRMRVYSASLAFLCLPRKSLIRIYTAYLINRHQLTQFHHLTKNIAHNLEAIALFHDHFFVWFTTVYIIASGENLSSHELNCCMITERYESLFFFLILLFKCHVCFRCCDLNLMPLLPAVLGTNLRQDLVSDKQFLTTTQKRKNYWQVGKTNKTNKQTKTP